MKKKNRRGGQRVETFTLHKETLRRLSDDNLARVAAGGSYTSGASHIAQGESICDPCHIAPACA